MKMKEKKRKRKSEVMRMKIKKNDSKKDIYIKVIIKENIDTNRRK